MEELNNTTLIDFLEHIKRSEEFKPLLQQFLASEKNKRLSCEGSSSQILSKDKVVVRSNESALSRGNSGCPMIDSPTYDQIFRVPKKKARDGQKLYGRTFLAKHFLDQHAIFLSNLQKVRMWFSGEFDGLSDLRHKPLEKQKIKDIIKNNIHEITPLSFPGASYQWKEQDIYLWVLVSIQSKRKYVKKKNQQLVTCDDTSVKSKENDKLESLVIEAEYARSDEDMQEDDAEMTSMEVNDTCNDEEKYIEDVNNGTQFPCGWFLKLLEDNPTGSRSLLNNEEKMNEHHVSDDENKVRKSKRSHKLSMKMQNIVEAGKHVSKGSHPVRVMKKMKGLSELERPSFKAKTVHDVHTFDVEDLETIAMKYYNIHTVDELYKKLKDLYSSLKISKKNHGNEHDSSSMIRELVIFLFQDNKIVVHKHRDKCLLLEDIEVNA